MGYDRLGLTGVLDARQELARMEEMRRSALRPVDLASVSVQNIVRDAYAASSIAEVGRRAADSVAALRLNGIAEVSAGIAETMGSQMADWRPTSALPFSVLDSSATAAMLKSDGQWKAGLMRWSEPPFAELISTRYADVARAVSDAVRPQLLSASYMADLYAAQTAASALPSIELPGFDLTPWLPAEPEETPEDEPAPQYEDAEVAPSRTAPTSVEPELLLRRIEASESQVSHLEREVARLKRPFVIRWGERIVVGLLVKVIWEQTPISDYSAVAIDKLEVVIDGITYILPYVP